MGGVIGGRGEALIASHNNYIAGCETQSVYCFAKSMTQPLMKDPSQQLTALIVPSYFTRYVQMLHRLMKHLGGINGGPCIP
jgi:DNA repair photolyase